LQKTTNFESFFFFIESIKKYFPHLVEILALAFRLPHQDRSQEFIKN